MFDWCPGEMKYDNCHLKRGGHELGNPHCAIANIQCPCLTFDILECLNASARNPQRWDPEIHNLNMFAGFVNSTTRKMQSEGLAS